MYYAGQLANALIKQLGIQHSCHFGINDCRIAPIDADVVTAAVDGLWAARLFLPEDLELIGMIDTHEFISLSLSLSLSLLLTSARL